MFIRIIWGKVRLGQWPEFERAYKQGLALSGTVKGLKGRWLAEDVDDRDAGFSISLWDSDADMRAYATSPLFKDKVIPLVQPFFVGEYKETVCEVRVVDRLGA